MKQIVPIGASALLSSKIVKDAHVESLSGIAARGMCSTRKDEVNRDLLAFFQG